MSDQLTLSEVARELDVPRATVVRLVEEPTGYIAKWLQVQGKPPTIPRERLRVLTVWAQRRDTDPRLRPAAIAQSLAESVDLDQVLLGEALVGDLQFTGERSPATGELTRALTPSAIQAVETIVESVVARVVDRALPPPDDRLILAPEVRDLLAGPIPKALPPKLKSPARWRRSDVLRWIQGLG